MNIFHLPRSPQISPDPSLLCPSPGFPVAHGVPGAEFRISPSSATAPRRPYRPHHSPRSRHRHRHWVPAAPRPPRPAVRRGGWGESHPSAPRCGRGPGALLGLCWLMVWRGGWCRMVKDGTPGGTPGGTPVATLRTCSSLLGCARLQKCRGTATRPKPISTVSTKRPQAFDAAMHQLWRSPWTSPREIKISSRTTRMKLLDAIEDLRILEGKQAEIRGAWFLLCTLQNCSYKLDLSWSVNVICSGCRLNHHHHHHDHHHDHDHEWGMFMHWPRCRAAHVASNPSKIAW